MKAARYRKGLRAEALCRFLLRLKGYRILAARYKSPLGEIDIVAGKGETIAVIEVKARETMRAAAEAISPKQRQRLARAALDFLARHPHLNRHHLRFDTMLVASRRWPQHVKDAWRPDIF